MSCGRRFATRSFHCGPDDVGQDGRLLQGQRHAGLGEQLAEQGGSAEPGMEDEVKVGLRQFGAGDR